MRMVMEKMESVECYHHPQLHFHHQNCLCLIVLSQQEVNFQSSKVLAKPTHEDDLFLSEFTPQ